MTKRTLSNKGRYSVLKVSGFRARMATPQGRKILRNRRKKGRKVLAIRR
jgi:large subunit ribosomal protein L34